MVDKPKLLKKNLSINVFYFSVALVIWKMSGENNMSTNRELSNSLSIFIKLK